MGTRGYKAWRFRKRYYIQYYQYDTYPTGLGKDIAEAIPTNTEGYLAWLKAERTLVEGWEAIWDDYLAVELGAESTVELPAFFEEHNPTWLVPLNDTWIEWVYIVDLDREVLSVNNGAHFKLDQIPKINWIESLADGGLGDKIALPGLVPEAAITNLVAEPSKVGQDITKDLDDLRFEEKSSSLPHRQVKPKDVADIPWRLRHGPIFNSLLFWIWSRSLEDELAATLLQWSPEDFPFREIAFAVLCLALGGKHVTLLPDSLLRLHTAFGEVEPKGQDSTNTQFVSSLATGAHVRGGPLGSAPEEVIYWLEGVLVVLSTQLYRANAVDDGVTYVARYCQRHHPNDIVDAVLLSIEHVVLIHAVPGMEVQRSPLMPLFVIPNHLTMDVKDRYAQWYLEKLTGKDENFMKKEKKKQKQAWKEMMLKNDGIDMHFGDTDDEEEDEQEEPALFTSQAEAEGDANHTFYALIHLFDAAACRRMPPAKAREGRFPNEIYSRILAYVTDPETRHSCMQVSRLIRQISQETLVFADGVALEPCEAAEACVSSDQIPKWFNMHDLKSGSRKEVEFKRSGGLMDSHFGNSFSVLVGTGRNTKSLLPHLSFKLPEIK